MKTNLKFHAIAITSIVVVITALYVVMAPKDQGPIDPNATNANAIEIYSATWGIECNPYITRARQEGVAIPPTTEAGAAPAAANPPKMVTPNNVLVAVSASCNGKLSCEMTADSQSLGVEPLDSCFKRLAVAYRCYAIDRLRTIDIGQGEKLSIDCSNPDAADASPKPTAK